MTNECIKICAANGCFLWVSHCLLSFFSFENKKRLVMHLAVKPRYELLQLVTLVQTRSTDGLENIGREEGNQSQSEESQL